MPWLLLLGLVPGGPVAARTSAGEGASYSWRPGVEVPWWNAAQGSIGSMSIGSIPFGELGRTPATRFYLTFNHDLEREFAGESLSWRGDDPLPEIVPGRFGGGLRLDATRLRFRIAKQAAPARQFTLECWVRPEVHGPGPLFALTGLLNVRCDATGRVMVQTPGTLKDPEAVPRATLVTSPGHLRLGTWNHVGVVLDLVDTRSLRVSVNGEARAKSLAGPLEPPERLELVLGSAPGKVPACVIDEFRLQARAANTEEFLEALAEPRPLERLRLTRDGVTEEHEVWWGMQRSPRIDSPEAWRLGELERVVADERGLRHVAGNWRKIQACDPPVARTTQISAFIGRHRILMFGGETRDSHAPTMRTTDDTWIFDTLAESWQRLTLPLAPEGRAHQGAAYCPERDLVFLAGGFEFIDDKPRRFEDTWLFHVGQNRWERGGPDPRNLPTSDDGVVYDARHKLFVLIRGSNVRTFDPATGKWSRKPDVTVVDERGTVLDYLPAEQMMAGYDPTTGTMVVFGGTRDSYDDELYLNDCYLYDLESNRLTLLELEEAPPPRVRGGFGWDETRGRFVLFGGVRSQRSTRMDDLWSFDPRTRKWTEHEAAHGPSQRGGYFGMEYDPELERFFLLCGRHSKSRFLSEVWTLSLDEKATGRARYVFDRATFPDAKAWFADTETPADSRVTCRFRESSDALVWTAWSEAAPSRARYLQAEVTLTPGSKGEPPRVRSMGFRAE